MATGFLPNQPIIKFKMGFLGDVQPERSSTDVLIGEMAAGTGERYRYSDEVRSLDLRDYSHYCKNGCNASKEGFEMLLVVPLDAEHVDVWLVNDNKEMVLVKDGSTQ